MANADDYQAPIDTSKPRLRNMDGSFSTERTITVESDGKHFNIPTIVGGQQRSDDEAVAEWRGGRNPEVGAFGTHDEALAAARSRTAQLSREIADPDASNGYMAYRESASASAEAGELDDWLAAQRAQKNPPKPEEPIELQVEPFPIGKDRTPTVGQPITAAQRVMRAQQQKEESTAGKVMRNLGEIPGGAAAGIESAISHAMGWAINPLADWLNENVADLTYTREIDTPTGRTVKSISEFLTGFIPAMKGLRALGATGKVVAPLAAGAIADFSTRDPHEARLSNIWQELGLPKNVLTDYLAANPEDDAIEGRFKSALEGSLTGLAFEGVFLAARALRVSKWLGRTEQSKREQLRAQYGEITDDEMRQAFGDQRRPAIESTAPSQIKRTEAGKLTAEDVDLEDRFAAQLESNPERAMAEYAKLKDANGGKTLNTDTVRELSAEYMKNRSKAAAVHEPASWLTKIMYAKKLAEPLKPGEENVVLFTAGGTGAGKTTAIKNIAEIQNVADKAHIIYDTNMNTFDSAVSKIEQALDAGKNVHIALVVRDPVEALKDGALKRGMRQEGEFGSGRTVPIEEHTKTHVGSIETVKKLAAKYAGDDRVVIEAIDNARGSGNAVLVPLESVKNLDYAATEAAVKSALEEEWTAGRISKEIYEGFKGKPQETSGAFAGGRGPPEGVPRISGQVAGGQPQPQRGAGKGAQGQVTDTSRVSIGLAPGEGTGLTGEFTTQAATRVLRSAANATGVKVIGAETSTGAYRGVAEGSVHIDLQGSIDQLQDFADIIGNSLKQTEVIISKPLPAGATRGVTLVDLGGQLSKPDKAEAFMAAVRAKLPEGSTIGDGYQMVTKDGKPALRMFYGAWDEEAGRVNWNGTWSNDELAAFEKAFDETAQAQGLKLHLDDAQFNIVSEYNDWTRNAAGEGYRDSLAQRRSSVLGRLGDDEFRLLPDDLRPAGPRGEAQSLDITSGVVEDVAGSAPAGQEIVAFRVGSNPTLANRNAGNAQGVADFLARGDDAMSSVGEAKGEFLYVYGLTPKKYGSYKPIIAGKGTQATEEIGRRANNGVVAYSIPEGAGERVIDRIPMTEVRAALKKAGYETFDDAGSAAGAKVIRELVASRQAAPALPPKAAAIPPEAVTPADIIGGRGVVSIGDMKQYVNFARINGPDDMKATIAEMAERFRPTIQEAARGKITHAETAKLADDLGMDVDTLLSRRRGQGMNAEEALAARQLWAASGERLLEAARAAGKPGAGAVDMFAFRRAMALHASIQSEVVGARTETARALSAWRIPAGGSIERARAIEQALEGAGGTATTQEFARRLAILAEHGGKGAVAKMVEKGWGAKSFDVVREVWVNGLLSSPATHAVNTLSNTAVVFQQMVERGVAARIGQLRGTEGGVAVGEAMAMAHGMTQALGDAWSMAWKALKSGETGAALNKVDLPREHALSAETFGMASTGGFGRVVDFIGDTFRIPSRFLGAEDEFFKTIGYRAELEAQALRQATSEGLKGDALALRIRQIKLDPPENIKIAAADQALYNTFNNKPGDIGQAFLRLRERVPAISFVLPFIRTPVNIARYTFERTPFAPAVGQWRDDIAAGGARADLALARMATGSAIMLSALDWADSGRISGSGKELEQGERDAMTRQGWQPYSIQVGGRWYSYNRTDPFGAMLGFSADAAAAIRRGELNEDDVDEWNEVVAMASAAVAQVAVNKTYLRGLSEVFNVMADPTKNSERYISNLVSSFIPFTSLAGATERALDPTVRETANPWQAVMAKLTGLSEKLPPRRNLWGEEVRSESGLGKGYDFLSPFQSREIKPEAIDTEIMRLAPVAGADNVQGAAPTRISKRTSFQGVQVNFKDYPEVYDEYVRLSGYALEHPAFGKGAKDFLNDVVTGKSPISKVYNIRSDEMKLTFINQVIHQYRQLAQQEIMNDPKYEEFHAHVQATQALMQAQRMPVPAGATQ